ncbi:MAG: YraN family protein [Firmicutes bacterium]|nr:YraN family protein [Bacillota bacterium]
MNNLYKGRKGEDIAAEFFISKQYRILCRNYKTAVGELDLVAQDKDTLVFIEVKSRMSDKYGAPGEALTSFKRRKISQVAAQYIKRKKAAPAAVRFDVLEIFLSEGRVNHIEDAFESCVRFSF